MLKRKSKKEGISTDLDKKISRKKKKEISIEKNTKIGDFFKSVKKITYNNEEKTEKNKLFFSQIKDVQTEENVNIHPKKLSFLEFKNIAFPMVIDTKYISNELIEIKEFSKISIGTELSNSDLLKLYHEAFGDIG
jgi:hypothetical protein